MTLVSVIGEKRPYLDGTLEDPTGQWTGRSPGIFYSASIIWGAVSPKRFFSGGYEVLYLGCGWDCLSAGDEFTNTVDSSSALLSPSHAGLRTSDGQGTSCTR